MKKHKETSIYFIQAPTAPYREGAAETDKMSNSLQEMLESDIGCDREIVLGGDINSYPDRSIDYDGEHGGQTPSKLIMTLQNCNLIDIMRMKNEEPFYTFSGNNMNSRLDQYWVSSDIASKTIFTHAYKIIPFISDHAAIEMVISWPRIRKVIQTPKNHVRWNSKNETAVNQSKHDFNEESPHPSFSNTYKHEEFYKEYSSIAKLMRRITKRTFGNRKIRTKQRKHPPIWFQVMRNINKILANRNETKEETGMLIWKYFPNIEITNDWDATKLKLRTQAKILNAERKKKRIVQALRERFEKFQDNIGKHLDNILERKQIINISYLQKEEWYVTEPREVQEHFHDYYYDFFHTDSVLPSANDIDQMEYNEETIITEVILMDEYMTALHHLASNKAAGISGIRKEMIAASPLAIHQWILKAFNSWLKLNDLPKHMLCSQIWLIPKEIYDGNPANTRPINLIETPRKLFSAILTHRLANRLEFKNQFNSYNFDFREHLSTMNTIKSLQIIIEHTKIRKKKLCIVLLDIKKAYDSLECGSIIDSFKEMGIDKQFSKMLINTFANRRSCLMTMAGTTKFFQPKRGIEQGDPISPIIWNIFYDKILKKLNNMNGYNLEGINITYMAYADDLLLMSENEKDMRELIKRVNELPIENRMEIQAKKSLAVSNFERGDFSIVNSNNVTSQVTSIPKNSTFKYLGALFSLHERGIDIEELEKETEQMIHNLKSKKVSIRNTCYIFNHVAAPKICYRLSGTVSKLGEIEGFDSKIRQYTKNLLRLPRSFSTKYLYSPDYLIRLKPISDYFVEQEISIMSNNLETK